MRFYVHGQLTPAVAEAIRRHEHVVAGPPALAGASDGAVTIDTSLEGDEVLAAAHRLQVDLLTDDREVLRVARDVGVRFDRSLVFLQLAGGDVEQDDAVDRLFSRYKRLKPGQIYVLTETRVKVQQMKQRSPQAAD